MAEIAERVQEIRDRIARHAELGGICNSYYCGQDCSWNDQTWDMIWDLLNELAPETDRSVT